MTLNIGGRAKRFGVYFSFCFSVARPVSLPLSPSLYLLSLSASLFVSPSPSPSPAPLSLCLSPCLSFPSSLTLRSIHLFQCVSSGSTPHHRQTEQSPLSLPLPLSRGAVRRPPPVIGTEPRPLCNGPHSQRLTFCRHLLSSRYSRSSASPEYGIYPGENNGK